ncbi:unnamed protein product [Nezara viridula]|uniref:Dynein assembly factor 1, axonemal homolog n=1 Tax=Nezara viridula TaxID=85310 RepID=A0A9P0MT79_NEZVI|nr:unnamed protein product [Nezara viridula]
MKTKHHKKGKHEKNHFRARKLGEVLKDWHHMHYELLSEAREVILRGIWPPINAMDDSLQYLEECVVLSLSMNMIEKISHLWGLKNLKVLSLAQNNIKSLDGLEEVGSTLEVLIIARNFLKDTKGIEKLIKLKELDISYNYINQPIEFYRLISCQELKSLAFKENPFAEKYPDNIWRQEALKVLPNLETLDYIKVEDHERSEYLPMSEFFKLKGDMIIDSPKYMIYNDIFKEAMEKVLHAKDNKNDEEQFDSSNSLLSMQYII